jgi:phage head maturation protease
MSPATLRWCRWWRFGERTIPWSTRAVPSVWSRARQGVTKGTSWYGFRTVSSSHYWCASDSPSRDVRWVVPLVDVLTVPSSNPHI